MTRGIRKIPVVLALAVLCGVRAATADPGEVRTLAGSGALGTQDGAASDATFALPAGVARCGDGTLYVSDEAAQRIRMVRGDRVATVAGGGDLSALGFTAPGAYRDGAALDARFDRPLGLACAANGTVYVADAGNRAIRALRDGRVTTVAGGPGPDGAADGPVASARFVSPRALALDAKGDLWVADAGGGLRHISDGRVQTVALDPPAVDAVSVSVQPDDGTILVVAPERIYAFDPRSGHDMSYPSHVVVESQHELGTPDQIAAIGNSAALFTDLLSGNVRYVRFPQAPFVNLVDSDVIAGGASLRPEENQGDRDGPLRDARFIAPRGIAVGAGVATIADAGARRVRAFPLPAFRGPEVRVATQNAYDADHYQIAFVGPSAAFFDSSGDDDSICGVVERRLDASGRIAKPVRCHAIRIDAAAVPQIESYVTGTLAFRHVDMLVMSFPVVDALALDRSSPAHAVALFRTSMQHVVAAFPAPRPLIAIFWQYYEHDISDREALWIEDGGPELEHPPEFFRTQQAHDEQAVFDGLAGLPIAQCNPFDALTAYEKGTGLPLYFPGDRHGNARGNALLGGLLAGFLLKNLAR